MPISPSSKGGRSVDCSDILARQKRKIMLAIQNSKPVKGGQTQIANREFGFNSAFSLTGIDSYFTRPNTTTVNTNPNNCWTGYNQTTYTLSANAAAYGNGKWIAVGENYSGGDTFYNSTDNATTWSVITSTSDFVGYDIAYGNGIWIAVGSGTNETMYISSDNGLNWTPTNLSGSPLNGIAYGNGKWVAVGNATEKLHVSTDNANTWNSVSGLFSGLGSRGNAVASDGNNTWVVVGQGTGPSMYVSTDNANTWSSVAISLGVGNGVAYGNGKWVAVGASSLGNTVFVSANGVNWTVVPGLFPSNSSGGGTNDSGGYGVAHANGTWVAVGTDTQTSRNIFISTDNAVTWNAVIPTVNIFIDGEVAYGNGTWVITTSQNDKIYSTKSPTC